MDVARVRLVAAVEGGAGVVSLVGGLGGGGDGERAVGEDLLAPVARQLVAVCKRMREKRAAFILVSSRKSSIGFRFKFTRHFPEE